jgi:hypothetical protein
MKGSGNVYQVQKTRAGMKRVLARQLFREVVDGRPLDRGHAKHSGPDVLVQKPDHSLGLLHGISLGSIAQKSERLKPGGLPEFE